MVHVGLVFVGEQDTAKALLGSPNKQIVTPKTFSDGNLEILGKQASFDLRVRVPHNRW